MIGTFGIAEKVGETGEIEEIEETEKIEKTEAKLGSNFDAAVTTGRLHNLLAMSCFLASIAPVFLNH